MVTSMCDGSLVGALAALLNAHLLVELNLVHELEERRSLTVDSLTSLNERSLKVGSLVTRAASLGLEERSGVGSRGRLGTSSALRSIADELALGAGAESGLLALPVALGVLAHGSADGVGGNARGTALSGSADSLALRAVSLGAEILGAADVALRLVAVDLALGAGGLLAVNLALGALADRVALSGADGVIALPTAGRVAVLGGSGGLDRCDERDED